MLGPHDILTTLCTFMLIFYVLITVQASLYDPALHMAKLHGSPEPRPAEASYHWVWARLVAKIVLAVLTAPYRRTFKLYTWKPLRDFRDADGDPKRLIPMVSFVIWVDCSY
jgi:hypothetical protein